MNTGEPSIELEMTNAFLQMCGITYGETYIRFDRCNYQLGMYEDIHKHIDNLVVALKKVTNDKAHFNTYFSNGRHRIYLDGNLVAVYEKTWLGKWKCRRRQSIRIHTATIKHGDFVLGLLACVFGAMALS